MNVIAGACACLKAIDGKSNLLNAWNEIKYIYNLEIYVYTNDKTADVQNQIELASRRQNQKKKKLDESIDVKRKTWHATNANKTKQNKRSKS